MDDGFYICLFMLALFNVITGYIAYESYTNFYDCKNGEHKGKCPVYTCEIQDKTENGCGFSAFRIENNKKECSGNF